MVSHTQTRTYNGSKLKPAIYSILSPAHPMTRCQISLALNSSVGNVRLWRTLNELIDEGKVIKVAGHPDLFYRAMDENEITARGRVRVKA